MQIPKYFYFRVKPGKFDITLEDASDVDVAEVVRCRECKYSAPNGIYGCTCYHFKQYETHGMGANDFCSYGERKEGDE